ncbi:TPA: ATP-binding cassette domain-containing protein [Salmonella enterica]
MSAISEECYSFIRVYELIAENLDASVTPENISTIIKLYPGNGDVFDDVFCYAGEVLGVKFIKTNFNKNNQGTFIIYKEGEWFFSNCIDSSMEGRAYIIIPVNPPDDLSFLNIIRFCLKNRVRFVSIIITSFILSLTALAIPLYMSAVYSKIIPAFAESSLWSLSLLLILFFILDVYLKHQKINLFFNVIKSFTSFMETQYLRILSYDISSKKNDWGKNRNIAVMELFKIKSILWLCLTSNTVDILFCIVYFITIAAISGYLVLVPLFISVFFIVVVFYLVSTSNNEQKENQDLHSFADKISLLPFYQAEGKTDLFLSSYVSESIKFNDIYSKNVHLRNNISSLITFLSSFQTVAIIIMAFYMVRDFGLSVGSIFAAIILSGKIIQTLSPLPNLISLTRELKKLFNIINNSLSSCSNSVIDNKIFVQDSTFWRLHKCTVSYDDKHNALENISLNICEGEKVAIVGPTNSGKSTLIHLLLGVMIPSSGAVYWNEDNRYDSLHSRTFFSQQNLINNSSLFDYYDCDLEKLSRALSFEFMSWVTDIFDKGIYHPPSDVSLINLTSEKRQLLEISRLLVSDKDIFILDEPSTSLSFNNSNLFYGFLKQKKETKDTFVIATSNKDIISIMKRVVYIENGKVIFDGSSQKFLSSIN